MPEKHLHTNKPVVIQCRTMRLIRAANLLNSGHLHSSYKAASFTLYGNWIFFSQLLMRRISVFIEQIFPSSVALLNGNFTLLCAFPREPKNVNECQAHIPLSGWISKCGQSSGLLQAHMLIRLHLHRRLLTETDNYFAPCRVAWGGGAAAVK